MTTILIPLSIHHGKRGQGISRNKLIINTKVNSKFDLSSFKGIIEVKRNNIKLKTQIRKKAEVKPMTKFCTKNLERLNRNIISRQNIYITRNKLMYTLDYSRRKHRMKTEINVRSNNSFLNHKVPMPSLPSIINHRLGVNGINPIIERSRMKLIFNKGESFKDN